MQIIRISFSLREQGLIAGQRHDGHLTDVFDVDVPFEGTGSQLYEMEFQSQAFQQIVGVRSALKWVAGETCLPGPCLD